MRPSPVKPAVASRETLLAVLILIGATVAVYARTFAVPFLFDDFLSIKDNATIRHLASAWSPPAGDGITVSGRPLLNFTFALNYALSGASVWSYHAANLLIHVAAAVALFGLVRRTLRSPRLAGRCGPDATSISLAIAGLWALHPLQTESVTYLVQRAESLAGLLLLLTLACFARAVAPGGSRGWLAAAWISCLLGMAAKETMATAPGLILLYDRMFAADSWREVGQKRGRFHLALAATWGLLAILVVSTGSRGGSVGFAGGISPASYALTQAGAIVHYLRLVFWPHPLVLDYGTALAANWGEVWWQGLLLLALLASSLWAGRRHHPAGFAGLGFFLLLAPSSSVVPVVTQTMAEHRMYLALAAVVAVVVLALHARWGRRGLAACGLGAVALGAATVGRNETYRSETGIWEQTVAARPNNARAQVILGTLYERADRLPEALARLQFAVELEPANAEAWNNLGDVRLKQRDWPRAIDCYRRALAIKPDQAQIMSNLGITLEQAGDMPAAIAQLEAALRIDPTLATTRHFLAGLLVQRGRLADAEAQYATYLRDRPDDGEAHADRGAALLALGRGPEGLAELERAVALRPDNATLQNNLGIALARSGRVAEALPHFREAVRLKPDFLEARQNAEHAARSLERR